MSTYKIKINSRDYEVSINSIVGNKASVCVNGREYEALVEEPAGPVVAARPKNLLNASSAPLNEAVPATPVVAGAVTSPLPGVILSIAVKE
ncbi:MAG: acetyl-CoA carboxylase biotin carboxyl carrier protein subunit, partial [Candidatus Cryptobacteroides sp.]